MVENQIWVTFTDLSVYFIIIMRILKRRSSVIKEFKTDFLDTKAETNIGYGTPLDTK